MLSDTVSAILVLFGGTLLLYGIDMLYIWNKQRKAKK